MGNFLDALVETIVDFFARNKDAFMVSVVVSLTTAIIMGALSHWWVCVALVLAGRGHVWPVVDDQSDRMRDRSSQR
jgi:hypothetical protein